MGPHRTLDTSTETTNATRRFEVIYRLHIKTRLPYIYNHYRQFTSCLGFSVYCHFLAHSTDTLLHSLHFRSVEPQMTLYSFTSYTLYDLAFESCLFSRNLPLVHYHTCVTYESINDTLGHYDVVTNVTLLRTEQIIRNRKSTELHTWVFFF